MQRELLAAQQNAQEIREYNAKVKEQREKYQQYLREEEVKKLKSNPTEDRMIYSNEYEQNLNKLRQI